MKQNAVKFKGVEDKTITWFENTNQYLILENTTADIIKRLVNGKSVSEIAKALSKKIVAPQEKTVDFILDIQKQFLKKEKQTKIVNDYRYLKIPTHFSFVKYYKIDKTIFKVSFLNERELSLIHPKFSHLEIQPSSNYNHHFQVFINNNFIFLYVDDKFIDSWSNTDIHYFQGKFSMELIQKIHQKEENDWMGVFHASALSNQNKAILFLGDSGNGKSTSLALLQANGFTCLADDFVPIAVENKNVYAFPAGISIKKSSLDTLLPIYPELENSAEYNFERLNKIVRFLRPNISNFSQNLPCKEIIFIKYVKDSELKFEEISKLDSFQKLVPDSWLSQKKENVETFLDWFSSLKCYQLTYSNNDEMITKVSKIFNDDI